MKISNKKPFKNDLSGLIINGYAFSANMGWCVIIGILKDGRILAYSLEIRGHETFTKDGYRRHDLHPTLFKSPEDCSKYFKNPALRGAKLPPYSHDQKEMDDAAAKVIKQGGLAKKGAQII